jgi:protein-S-isoprenylcysteine O-methyltransferase Ste14
VSYSSFFATTSAIPSFGILPISLDPFQQNKLIEKKELEIRFGKKYIEYKKRTPFLIPYPKREK